MKKCEHKVKNAVAYFDDEYEVILVLCCEDCGASITITGERVEERR